MMSLPSGIGQISVSSIESMQVVASSGEYYIRVRTGSSQNEANLDFGAHYLTKADADAAMERLLSGRFTEL